MGIIDLFAISLVFMAIASVIAMMVGFRDWRFAFLLIPIPVYLLSRYGHLVIDPETWSVWAARFITHVEPIIVPIGIVLTVGFLYVLLREREVAAKAARDANKAKSEFLASMSHELRTPLNVVLGFSDVMRKEMFGPLDNDKYREYVDDIHSSGAHLLALINDVLDIAKIEAGKQKLNAEDVDVRPVINECLELVQLLAEEKGLTLVHKLPAGVPLVRLDRQHLLQILFNLLSNAIKFTPPQGRVEVTVTPKSPQAMEIRVSDTGLGIAAQDLPRIMENFERGSQVQASAMPGTGLGLALVKRLTELNAGTVEIRSKLHEGTVVTLVFPIAQPT